MTVRGSEQDNISHKSADSHTAVGSMFFGNFICGNLVQRKTYKNKKRFTNR